MAGHTSEKRWEKNNIGDRGVSTLVKESALNVQSALSIAKDTYDELLELWQFVGGTDQLVADQLFYNVWFGRISDPAGAPGVEDTQANATEVAMVADAKAAMLATYQLFGAMTNEVTSTADRLALLRRMS